MKLFRLGAAFVLLAIASGCATEYSFTPPESEQGLICVGQCQERQQTCRVEQNQLAADAYQRCEVQSDEDFETCNIDADHEFSHCTETARSDYYSCLKYSADRSACQQAECKRPACNQPVCYEKANHSGCDSDFRACFQQCGGSVTPLK